jgi:hypothetical protein
MLQRHADDPSIEAAFVELGTRRRPELEPTDRDVLMDWVLVRKQGVELGFVDDIFFRAGERWKRRRKGVPLLLFQIYFYTQRDDIADFSGKLPFAIEWSDNRDRVRRKLSNYESTRRSYLTDTWEMPGFRMVVAYKEEGSAADSVLCLVDKKPWPEKGRLQPALDVEDWLSLFGLPATSPELRKQLQPLDVRERIREGEDEHEVDFTFECGLQLYFTEAKALRRTKKAAPVKRNNLVLGAVTFFRSRELDARQWTGELPFRLSFDDSPLTMLAKVGPPPNRQKDDQFSGVAQWDIPEFSLKVLYNNVENHLLRVTLMAPGFSSG